MELRVISIKINLIKYMHALCYHDFYRKYILLDYRFVTVILPLFLNKSIPRIYVSQTFLSSTNFIEKKKRNKTCDIK